MPVVECVVGLAEKYATSPACVALKWLMDRPGITAPIVGISRTSQLDDILNVLKLQVSPEDMQVLDAVSRQYTDRLPHFRTLFDPTIVEDPDQDE